MNRVEKLRRWLFPIGGGAYGVKPLKPINPNERSSLSVRCGRLQLVLAFDTFIVALIALIVELIKSQQKMVNPTTTKNGKKIETQVPTVELGSPKLRI